MQCNYILEFQQSHYVKRKKQNNINHKRYKIAKHYYSFPILSRFITLVNCKL